MNTYEDGQGCNLAETAGTPLSLLFKMLLLASKDQEATGNLGHCRLAGCGPWGSPVWGILSKSERQDLVQAGAWSQQGLSMELALPG